MFDLAFFSLVVHVVPGPVMESLLARGQMDQQEFVISDDFSCPQTVILERRDQAAERKNPVKVGNAGDLGCSSDVFGALVGAGVPVTMVSRLNAIGETLPYPPVTVGAARERLMSGDFDFVGGHYLRSINPQEVEVGVLYTERSRRIAARTVILVSFNAPNREIAEALTAQGHTPHLIGDVRARSSIMSAIHGAAELGRRI